MDVTQLINTAMCSLVLLMCTTLAIRNLLLKKKTELIDLIMMALAAPLVAVGCIMILSNFVAPLPLYEDPIYSKVLPGIVLIFVGLKQIFSLLSRPSHLP